MSVAVLRPLQTNIVRNIIKFFMTDLVELLAASLELFVDFDGLLGHLLVSFLRATNQGEIMASGDALVTVGVESDAQQQALAFLFLAAVRHAPKLGKKVL